MDHSLQNQPNNNVYDNVWTMVISVFDWPVRTQKPYNSYLIVLKDHQSLGEREKEITHHNSDSKDHLFQSK